MGNFAYALGQGISKAAEGAVGLIDMKIKEEAQREAEERAADLKVSVEERLLAAKEMANSRAAERFQAIAQRKKNEPLPVTADPVVRTTAEGAKAAGLEDGLVNMTREQVAAYGDPEMMAQFDAQLAADNRLAQERVAGQTRTRTTDEAISAAMDEAKLTDIMAFEAGKKAFGSDKYMAVPDGASIWNTQTGKLVFANTSKAERQELLEEKKDERARLAEEGRDRRHQATIEMQEKRLEAVLKKFSAGGDRVLQHQFMNSLENDIRDAESRIKAMEKLKTNVTTPKAEREAADETIKELTARKEMLRRSKIEFARDAGIKIPESYSESSTPSPKPAGPENDPLGLFSK